MSKNRSIAPKAKKDALAALINKVIAPRERIELAAELARGIKVVKMVKKGKDEVQEIVFTSKPDLEAIRFLEENASGKPVQRQVVEAGEGVQAVILMPPMNPLPNVAAIRTAKAEGSRS